MESRDFVGDLATYFQHMALRKQLEDQHHMLPSEMAVPFDAALLNAEQDVEHNIDQEIQHLMQIKQQLQKRQQHRLQQSQLLLGNQQNQQARLSPVTSGFTAQSFGVQQSSTSPGWSTAGDTATAARYATNPPRHSIDLGTLASMSALGQGQPSIGACFNTSNGFNGDSRFNSSQQGQSPFAGQVGGAVVIGRIPAGLPRSPLPSSNNLAAAASVDAAAGVNNNMLISVGTNVQHLQLEQSNGMLGLQAGVLNSSSINCSTSLMSQELSPLFPQEQQQQEQQLYVQSMLYAPAMAVEASGAASAQSQAPCVFGAVSNPTSDFTAHDQEVQLADVVPDFSYMQQQQLSTFMPAEPGLATAADAAFGTSSNLYSFDLDSTPLTADVQGIMSTPNNPTGFGNVALLQQQEYSCRHSVGTPAFSSAAGMVGSYSGCCNEVGLRMPGQSQDNGLQVTGSSRSFTVAPMRAAPMAQVASKSGSFTAGCGQNMQCSMNAMQAMCDQSMHSMGAKGDLWMTRLNGPVPAAGHDARVSAVTGQLENTRVGGNRRASIDIGAYSRSRLGPGASPSMHLPAAAAGRRDRPGVPLFSTPPATPTAGGTINSPNVAWSSRSTPPTPSPGHHDAHSGAPACASARSDRTSRRNSSSSDASSTSNSSSSGNSGGGAAAKQQPMCAAPKWAGSFWHPLTDVVKRGPAAAKKGTGVFIPPGTTDLL